MALPALLAPAAVAAFIGSLATKILITGIGVRILIIVASVSAFTLAYAAFYTATNSALESLDYLNVPPFLQTAFTTLPANIDVCISLIIATKLAELVFRFQLSIINLRRS